jgi:hypothetical protein
MSPVSAKRHAGTALSRSAPDVASFIWATLSGSIECIYLLAQRVAQNSPISTQFYSGGTFFFTVTRADRHSNTLVDHIVALRSAFVRPGANGHLRSTPVWFFRIVCTPFSPCRQTTHLPGRWRRIKGHCTSALIEAGIHLKRRPATSPATSTVSISIRSNMDWLSVCAIGGSQGLVILRSVPRSTVVTSRCESSGRSVAACCSHARNEDSR